MSLFSPFDVMMCPQNPYEMQEESMLFRQHSLFSTAFPCMEEIRRQGKLCDVVLKVDDQAFSAHKIVLASTIPYFRAMFLNDMIESRQQEIKMQGIEANSLESLINFAYSGKLILDKNNVQSIMIGASFLQLHTVRDACAKYLLGMLHPQNALGIRQFADALGCQTLAESADKYIELRFHEVSLSEEYLNLTMKDVQNLLSKNELLVQSEQQVFEACMRWVKHNETRSENLPVLLSQVRLPLLTPTYLADRVATEELIRSSHQCRDLLDEARDFHLIPERRALLQSFRTKPRYREVRGHVYVVGGLNKHGDSLSAVEFYDPKARFWEPTTSMCMLRSRLAVAALRGKLYAFGGYNGKERLATVEMYDVTKDEWSDVTAMQCRRSALGATSLGDSIYVCGGYDGITSLNSVEKYNPQTDMWISLAPMFKSRSAGAVVSCHGYVYALGGHDGLSIFDSVERYDPSTNTWTQIPHMLTRRCRLGAAVLGEKIYACGGYDGTSFLKTAEMFDPSTNKWVYVASMNAQRSRIAVTANMGKLWAVGGYDGITNLISVETYDPKMNKWTFEAEMVSHEGGVGVGVISIE